MNVITYPKPYQSAFREACFVFGGVSAPSGVDISIISAAHGSVLGVKRIYAEGEASVNAAPYVRRLLSPEPLCEKSLGIYTVAARSVACRVSAGGYTSSNVSLSAGSDDAPVNSILSMAPETSKIRFGESDEISVFGDGNKVKPLITFRYDGAEYTDYSIPSHKSVGMLTFVVNADDAGALFTALIGADPSEMTEFTVSLQITVGVSDFYFERRYEVDPNASTGRRLAWINRYGAIDYCTFPYSVGGMVSGSRERIYTSGGYRTVATAAEISETLLSEPCDTDTAKWLAEIFSSPAVWTVDGGKFERVEVTGGSAEYSSARPGAVSVKIGPVMRTFSRKY